MKVFAIDPGPTQSAYCLMEGDHIWNFGIVPNDDMLKLLEGQLSDTHLVIEMIGHYGTGMPAGKEVFETCVWIGRFTQAYGANNTSRLLRATVKTHICGSARAKDPNVRQALIDKFGGIAATKKGGPLYKVSKDVWSALAIAVTWTETSERRTQDALFEAEPEPVLQEVF